jgi:hypothetical protein
MAVFAQDRSLLNPYCAGCHNERLKTAGLMLDKMDPSHVGKDAEAWEKVVRKIRSGMMPPSGAPRPARAALDGLAAQLETQLDAAAKANPNPGATALHRLNRTEYANAIRDLLGLEVDAATLLPADDSSEGFDNIADVLGVSPALLDRYTSAAAKISRLAVGDASIGGTTSVYRSSGAPQSEHIDGLPLGTRGGLVLRHNFPLDAEYAFKIRGGGGLPYDRRVAGMEVYVNGEKVHTATVGFYVTADFKLKMKAGPQIIGAALVENDPAEPNLLWQVTPGPTSVQSIAITGPLNPTGPGDTPSRRKIFICRPTTAPEEVPCAKRILGTLAKRAYRQPPSDADLETLLGFYQRGRNNGTFESGIGLALQRMLVSPKFVFRFEEEPDVAPGTPYRISDLELASRLSFFLWSSIPDDELLDLAIARKLHDPAVLEQQARRMLKDPRSRSLVSSFAGQWLYLREIKNAPAPAGGGLKQAFLKETEMLVESILREDRSIVDLLNADYTFVDERLARHYGIPNVYGSHFRRVTLKDENRRGLLGQGSLLLVTSVANRTSPVARGKWILENILGVAAPAPPPNVPPLDENSGKTQARSVRQRMEEHRANPTCAACHKIMDPIGLALENFDLNGKWRTVDEGTPIDASGELVDGTKLNGPLSLRQALLARSDVFVSTATEKLLTYGLGRGVRYYDMPVVRSVMRDASPDNYRLSSLVLGVVRSAPFQMRVKKTEHVAELRKTQP